MNGKLMEIHFDTGHAAKFDHLPYIATAKQNDSFVANTFEVVLRLRLHLEGVNTLVCQTRHFVFNRLYNQKNLLTGN